MKDCSSDLTNYHDQAVRLSSQKRRQLADRRDANRGRVRRGLEAADEPSPQRFVSQGSYAHGTTIQEPNNDYDIDDGVVFSMDSLVGPQGADKTALDARKMIRDSVDDGSFKTAPEIKPNCVRVFYDDGPHVDIPVYRSVPQPDGSLRHELASSSWRISDPDGVKDWFVAALESLSREERARLRCSVRLLKSLCKVRPSYSLPSGFALTALVVELFISGEARLDLGLRDLFRALESRLTLSLHVSHPVVGEWLIDASSEHKTEKLRDLLRGWLSELEAVDTPNATRAETLKAWKKIFNTDFFDSEIAVGEEAARAAIAEVTSSRSTAPAPWGERR